MKEVAKLPAKYSRAIIGRLCEGKTLQEVADAEGCSQVAVTGRIRSGLQQIRRTKAFHDLNDEFCYRHVSVKSFKNTCTSAVEWAVLKRERAAAALDRV